ncbi:MAG: PEP-utilizing enzyme, partial [Acidobacteriota bacterium]
PDGGAVVLALAVPDARYRDLVVRCAALVVEHDDPLSPTVLHARLHGVPTVVGVAGALWAAADRPHVRVDAGRGRVMRLAAEAPIPAWDSESGEGPGKLMSPTR